MKIPLGRPYIKKDVVLKYIEETLDTKWLSGGGSISKLENAIRDYNNDPDGKYIAVSNGTVAIELPLLMLNNGKRYTAEDEIITTSWSWVATGFVVSQVGATPVWADVNTYGVTDPYDVERKITPRTRAIILVHQMGIPADIDVFNLISEEHGIPIIEDSACALGSEYKGQKIGKSQNIVTYSFQARKVLTTGGEGGMIVVRNTEQEKWLRSFRAFGTNTSPLERTQTTKLSKEFFDKIGGNYKLSDVASAFGLAHLTYVDEEIELRRQAGEYYVEKVYRELIDCGYPVKQIHFIPSYCTKYNWQNYHILIEDIYRDAVVARLKEKGVMAKWDVQAIHREPVFNGKFNTDYLPITNRLADHGLWLPFFAEITRKDQDYVIETLKEVLDGLK